MLGCPEFRLGLDSVQVLLDSDASDPPSIAGCPYRQEGAALGVPHLLVPHQPIWPTTLALVHQACRHGPLEVPIAH